MLGRLVMAVVVGVLVTLACTLVGGLMLNLTVSFAVTIGRWLKDYAAVFGLLAALAHFFGGWTWLKK